MFWFLWPLGAVLGLADRQDTPEYFWEEDAWEPAYEALTAYLDIPLRVDNLNTRLVRHADGGGEGVCVSYVCVFLLNCTQPRTAAALST